MSAELTLLMTVDAVGGVWSYALSLARVLCRNGARVHLASMGPPPSKDQVEEAAAIRGLALHASDFDLEWMEDPWEDVARAGDWLLDLEERLAPDAVHLNGYAHGRLPFRAPVLCVAHSCVCSWWRAVHREEAPARWDRYRAEVIAGLSAARAVVAPTHAMLRELASDYGPFRLAKVIPNGIELDRTIDDRKERFFLAAGRLWDPAKNMALLARASRGFSLPILVAGSDTAPSGERIAPTGTTMLGLLSKREMEQWMARAPVLIHPALYEPFGLIPLEAAASGAALLLADIPSLREVWGGAALYFSPHDPLELAELARLIAADPPALDTMRKRARRRAEHHPIERTAARYLELYREISSVERQKENQRS